VGAGGNTLVSRFVGEIAAVPISAFTRAEVGLADCDFFGIVGILALRAIIACTCECIRRAKGRLPTDDAVVYLRSVRFPVMVCDLGKIPFLVKCVHCGFSLADGLLKMLMSSNFQFIVSSR
jgi:hypothetical protein